jgi:hypothetical protein
LNAVFLECMERLQKCMQIDGEYVGWAKRMQYIEIDLNREILLCYTWREIPYISIEGNDDRFVFDQKSFLINIDTSTAIRYFGANIDILISRDITILGSHCFCGPRASAGRVHMITFARPSVFCTLCGEIDLSSLFD